MERPYGTTIDYDDAEELLRKNDKTVIARWESRSGKHWAELLSDCYGFTWNSSDGSCGSFSAKFTLHDAVETMQHYADTGFFQPDANVTPMKLLFCYQE